MASSPDGARRRNDGKKSEDGSPRRPAISTPKPTPRRIALQDGVTLSSNPARDENTVKQKANAIEKILKGDPVDVVTLKQMAISQGGLLNDDLRKKAWPKLLGADVDNIPPKPDLEVPQSHRDHNQVILDVNRSQKRFPPGMDEEVRMSYQDQLIECIMRVLVHHDELHYYQGYHDIVVTFLLVVGEDITFALMDKLSKQHLRDFMYKTMDKTNSMLNYMYPIIGRANPELRNFIEKAELGTIFSLPWLITWYGHVLNDFKHIVRLYDFFIACDPLMPIYLAAAIVLHRQKEIMLCEPEMPIIHSLLSKIPDDLPLEALIQYAGDLYVQYPPKELEIEARLHFQRLEEKKRAENEERERAIQARKKAIENAKKRKRNSFLVKVTMFSIAVAVSAAAIVVWTNGSSWGSWLTGQGH